jgi:hypothetical protein
MGGFVHKRERGKGKKERKGKKKEGMIPRVKFHGGDIGSHPVLK